MKHGTHRRPVRRIAMAAVFTLSGCSLFEENPFAGFVVGDVNEEADQTVAAILIGDPQVSTRESLINDRMREVDFLERMIENSESVRFEPQLKRDLRVVSALAAQLGISFNPASGDAFERQEELAGLRADIEEVKLRNELARLKKLAEDDPSDSGLAPQSTQPKPPAGLGDPSIADIKSQLSKAVTAAETLLNEIKGNAASARAADTTIKASPEDHFEDLNAYRARLRQRQNEVRLDDVHDSLGHALYRMQFNAVVLPGAVKNKFGVLDAEIAPVQVSGGEIRLIYDQWLVSLAERSLRVAAPGAAGFEASSHWDRVQTELIRRDMFDRVLFDAPTSDPEETIMVTLFTYPGADDDTLIAALNGDAFDGLDREGIGEALSDTARIESYPEKVNGRCIATSGPKQQRRWFDQAHAILSARASISSIEVFLSSLESSAKYASAQASVDPQYIAEVKGLLLNVYSNALFVLRQLKPNRALQTDCYDPGAAADVPETFRERIAITGQDGNLYWAGSAYTYQAQPNERSQRISSVASAVNSMQMAFSLAAILPGQGIGLDAGVGASKTAVGMAEAIERTPLVIGYTDARNGGRKRFGYVFGPSAILNTDENKLEYKQVAKNHPVFADFTVPSWWPAIALKTRTAWPKNWHGTASALADGPIEEVRVRLRPRFSDIDRITEFVLDAPLLSDGDRPQIDDVNPGNISACSGDDQGNIVFTVRGTNLWRSPAAYLRGKRHRALKVLPDMKGLEVTFAIGSLPKPPSELETFEPLTVWTGLGPASYQVLIENSVLGRPCFATGGAANGGGPVLKPAASRIVGGAARELRLNLLSPLPATARDIALERRALSLQRILLP